MHILHIIDTLGVGGGAERNLASVLPVMTGHQHHVVYLLPPDGFAPVLRAAGVTVERVALDGPGDLPRVVSRLRGLASSADVVHTQNMLSDLLRSAVLGRAPVVTSIQTPPYSPEALATYSRLGRAKTHVIRQLDTLLSTQNELFIAVSRYARSMLMRRVRVPGSRIKIIYNAIDLAAIDAASSRRQELRAELGLAEGDVAIVSVGKLLSSKGQDLLVEAMPGLLARVPRARLVLVGEGPLRVTIERRSRELGVADRVKLLGLRQDVPAVLAACDVFTLASHFEGLPLSVAEAMAARLPCVLSPIDPHVEMQERLAEIDAPSSRLLLSASMKPAAFAEALARVAADGAARQAAAASSRLVVERHFNAAVTAPAMLEVFDEARRARMLQRNRFR